MDQNRGLETEGQVDMARLKKTVGVLVYFLNKDPEFLERRMRAREKEHKQKTIVSLGLPIFIAVLLIPGLDRRFGWSAVPPLVVIIADIIILAGYGLGVRVMRENRYASRIPGVSAACQIPLNPRDLVTGLLIGAP